MEKRIMFYAIALMILTMVTGCSQQESSDQNNAQQVSDETKPSATEPSTNQPSINQNTLSQVMCNGKEYAIDVQAQDAVVLLTFPAEQKTGDLKSSGLVQEIFEIGSNEKASTMQMETKYSFALTGEMGSGTEDFAPGKAVFIASLKVGNLEALQTKLSSIADYGFGLLAMHTGDQKGELLFLCKLEE